MAINFPSNPSVNDTHTVNGRTYIWTGEKWRRRRPRIEYVPPTMTVSNDFTAGSALKVDSDSSSVGIGTMTPNADDALTVGGDTTVDGHIDIYNSLTVGASASITGNLVVSGDILSPSFTGIPTAPTATAGTNTTQLATTAFVSTAVADLINAAPTALNTLDELAAALGDDANFASTITNSISLKQDASTALTTSTSFGGDVSGTYNSIVVANDSHTHSTYLPLTGGTLTGHTTHGYNIATPANYWNGLQLEVQATSGTAGIGLHRSGYSHVGIYHDTTNVLKFNMNSGTVTLNHNTGTIWGSGNDGSGSGLDADLLDGVHASGFVSTANNSSLNSDSRNTRGPTRLYRRDHNSDYSVQTYWTGVRWRLYGYNGDSNHADTHVGYADSAGNADTVDGYHASSLFKTTGGTINGSINVTSVSQSNEFQGDVGSASDVTYMFDGDTDTGMYRYGSGEAALSGNGTWRIRTQGYGVAVNYSVNMSAGTYNHAVCGGAANQIAFRWSSPYLKGSIDNVICANITNFSDARLKANIRDWDNGISILRQLRTVEYTPRDIMGFGEISGTPIEGLEPKDDIIGLIAQEVREILPSAVSGDPDGTELLSIAEDQMMAVIISALQNIDSRLQALEV